MSQRIKKAVQSELDPKTAGLIRHIMSILGTILMAVGILDGFDVSAFTELLIEAIGLFLTLYSMIASYFAKEKEVVPTNIPTSYPN